MILDVIKELSDDGLQNVIRNAGYLGMIGQPKKELEKFVQTLIDTDELDEIELLEQSLLEVEQDLVIEKTLLRKYGKGVQFDNVERLQKRKTELKLKIEEL